ncbi:MAG: hypothetical protein HRU35_03115 [Rickettsiaceae bacterium]|nr:hypothetical protein [Rickettsiaceae bacterium]
MYYRSKEWFTQEPITLLKCLETNKDFSNEVYKALCSKKINFPELCAQIIIEYLTCDNPYDLQGVMEEEEYQKTIKEQDALQIVSADNSDLTTNDDFSITQNIDDLINIIHNDYLNHLTNYDDLI